MLVNLPKQPGVTKQNAPMFQLYIASLSDVDIENWPAATGATISTDVLLPTKTWKKLASTPTSINPNAAPGEAPMNGILTLTPRIEGISDESLAWVYGNVGEDCVVVWERCSDKTRFIGGSPCSNGLKMTYTAIGTLDGGIGGIDLQFQGQECPEPFYVYTGTMDIEP